MLLLGVEYVNERLQCGYGHSFNTDKSVPSNQSSCYCQVSSFFNKNVHKMKYIFHLTITHLARCVIIVSQNQGFLDQQLVYSTDKNGKNFQSLTT